MFTVLKKFKIVEKISLPYLNNYFKDGDNLWLTSKSEILLRLKNNTFDSISKRFKLKSIGYNDIKKFKNKIIISSKEGLVIFNENTYENTITIKNGLYKNDNIRCLFTDDTTLWIGTKKGLASTKDLMNFTYYNSNNGIDECEIKCINKDKNGLLWVGTTFNGLFKMIATDIVKYPQTEQVKDFSTFENNLYALVGKTIKKYNTDSNKFISYLNFKVGENLSRFTFDAKGNIYALDNQIIKYDGKQYTNIEHKLSQNQDNQPYSIASYKNYVWAGLRKSLLRINVNTGQIDTFNKHTLKAAYFQDIKLIDSTVIAATDAGLLKITNTYKKLITEQSAYNFPSGILNCIETDKYNHIWIAADLGLYCIEGDTAYSNLRKNLFPTNEISDIAVLDTFLLAATGKGLIQVLIRKHKNQNNYYQIINQRKGLNDVDLTGGRLFSDGKYIWISNKSNIYRYKPENQISLNIPLYITDIKNDSASLVFGNSKNFIVQPVNVKEELVLKYKNNNFNIEFNGINYQLFDNVYYSYRLLGLTSNWSLPDINNKAVYTSLAPGTYTFELSLSNGKNNFGKNISYTIIILPPIYLTWWFKVLSGIFLLLLIFIFIKLRTIKVVRQNQILESKINLRTSELLKKSNELSHSNEQLSNKNKLITESLEYAKKIQETILPSQNYLQLNFKNSFEISTIYLPKDIVGGDFYYAYNKNNINYFAVIDCTGHGVPGALLTFSVYTILQNIIDSNSVLNSPSEIIKQLLSTFSHTYNKDSESKESFAISLVVIQNQFAKIATVSQSVSILTTSGINEYKSNQNFFSLQINTIDEFEVQLNKDDIIMLYSDGYYDQKHFLSGKKMYRSAMNNFLLQVPTKNIYEQTRYLLNSFNDFKGGSPQIDDVCLMLIKYIG
ncbi:MAG: SpoIIE family protein phosphatase [Bacteroidetes bacterium]|nr:SpoIIE family protein phosphatase [Bacteroidota bacterium]